MDTKTLELYQKEYESVIKEGVEVIRAVEHQMATTTWAGMRKIYDVCERAYKLLDDAGQSGVGRKRAGFTSMVKVYHDLSLNASVSPASVRNAHNIYRNTVKVLGSPDSVEKLCISPTIIKTVVNNIKLSPKIKEELIIKTLEDNLDHESVKKEILLKTGETGDTSDVFRSTAWMSMKPNFDPRYGCVYPGRLQYQVAKSLLYHYTSERALCFFPFVGGGTEADVAKEMNRRYLAWDINFVDKVKKNHGDRYFEANSFKPWALGDYTEEQADLIFADMPKYLHGDGRWDENVENNKNINPTSDDIQNLLEYILLLTDNAKKHTKVGGVYAIHIRQPRFKEVPNTDLSVQAISMIERFFTLESRMVTGYIYNSRQDEGIVGLRSGFGELLVFRKV